MKMNYIHPNAIVEDGAKLGENVKIEAFAFVSKDAVIGNNVLIKQGARILGKTEIGDDSKIFSYAVLGDIPQDISYKEGDFTALKIGKRATIREFCTINSGSSKGDGYTLVGDDAFIMAYVHIAHDCRVGSNVIFANCATLAGHVEVGDYAVIGGLSAVHQFVRIGEHCMIGGTSGIAQDIVPFCLAEGRRASVRSLNLIGLRRRFSKAEIENLNNTFRKFYNANSDLKILAQEIKENSDDKNVIAMCDFIIKTKRGIKFEKGKGDE